MKNLFTSFFILFSFFVNAQYEPKVKGEYVKYENFFSLDYNEKHLQADWVFYTLSSKMNSSKEQRTNNFRPDKNLKSKSASLSDYKDSGYDRGHLCPAADMSFSKEAMSASFYLTNMSPQHPSFNRGVWKRLETKVRELLEKDVDLAYIVCGGIFKDCSEAIGENKISIPGYFYKIIFIPEKKQMYAFIIPNKGSSLPISAFSVSVDKVEEIVGIDFFDSLEKELQDSLEAQVSYSSFYFD